MININKIRTKQIWKGIRFRYKQSFFNESTLEEAWSFNIVPLTAIIYLGIFAFLLICLTSVIIIMTPIRNYLPGYLDVEVRKEILQNSLRADSLEKQIKIQARYLENITAILNGDITLDSVEVVVDSISYIEPNFDIPRGEREDSFIRKFEEEEKYNLTSLNPNPQVVEQFFCKPINGVISSSYNYDEGHYGIDLTAAPKSNVMATLDGTVVYAGFDPQYGNVIAIQHKNDFISFYKHNDILLKHLGDRVVTGEAIAIAGNTGELSTGLHLHFELWHNGFPVNPVEYIAF